MSLQEVTIGRYKTPADLNVPENSIKCEDLCAGWIEGKRDDGSTWILFFRPDGSPWQFYKDRDPDGGVACDPIYLDGPELDMSPVDPES